MFEKIKQVQQLRELQKAAASEKFTSEKHGVTVTLNGAFVIEHVSIAEDISKEDLEAAVMGACNDAMKKAQMAIAQKFSGFM